MQPDFHRGLPGARRCSIRRTARAAQRRQERNGIWTERSWRAASSERKQSNTAVPKCWAPADGTDGNTCGTSSSNQYWSGHPAVGDQSAQATKDTKTRETRNYMIVFVHFVRLAVWSGGA